MNKTLAQAISILGHPLLVLSYVLWLMLASNPYAFGSAHWTDKRAMLLLLSVFVTTFFIPGMGVAIMKPLGLIKSLQMEDKQERIGPYIITGVFYLWLFKNLLSGGPVPALFSTFVLGATIGLFFAFFVNIFSKISAHATGMGGMILMAGLMCLQWGGSGVSIGPLHLSFMALLALVVLFAGLVGTARLSLRAHNMRELLQGYAAGALGVLLATFL